MKIKLTHVSYMAHKISKDIFANPHISIVDEEEKIVDIIYNILEKEVQKEMRLEAKVDEMLDNVGEEVVDEFEYMDINYKQVFWMAKKRLAKEYDFILETEDRHNDISHQIITKLTEEDCINYIMTETILKNVVFDSIVDFIGLFAKIEDAVHERITHYKRKLTPGTEDYDLVYRKLYEEELVRKGLA